MEVRVDESLCSGCEVCVDTAPDVFEMNDDDVVEVKVNPVPADSEEACTEAVESCPSEAIIIEGA